MRGKCRKPPEKGDERSVTIFLWFPVCINYHWRWLETVIIHQRFEGWNYGNFDCYEFQLWENLKFID